MTESFYRCLVKTPLSLQQRSYFADSVATHSRRHNSSAWQQILSNAPKLSSSLKHLDEKGYLRLSTPIYSSLIDDLISLSPKKFLDPNYVHSSESYHLANVDKLPSVLELLNNTALHSLVSLYLNAPARISDCIAWWHFPQPITEQASNAQKWHRDRDDFAELKLFMYGTDVDAGSGPHAFIPGSHKSVNIANLFPNSKTDDPVIYAQKHTFLNNKQLSDYGLSKSNIKQWVGPKGTTFLEDTRGLHRAFRPVNKSRLIFSIVWTVASGTMPDIY